MKVVMNPFIKKLEWHRKIFDREVE